MDTSRLARVRDICPLSPNIHWLYATEWMAAIMQSTVVTNKFITWHRTFTKDDVVPKIISSNSFITINEWCPTVWPREHAGWHRFGIQHREAIVFLNELDTVDFTRFWSSHARRHLSAFKKNKEITLRLGTPEEFEKNITHSQVPPRLHSIFIDEVRKHTVAHSETIEVLIAEHARDGVIACFVAGNIAEAHQSYYISGFFKRGTEKLHAKTGLIDWWFRRSIERGYTTVNFGHIVGPRPLPGLEQGLGYSNFKTHFGIRRVWWPGSFWNIKFQITLRTQSTIK